MRRLPVLNAGVTLDRDGVGWRRLGECNRCGACCRSGDPYAGERGPGPVAGACPFYREEGGVGACADRSAANAYYVNGCALWPSEPAHVEPYPRCSYTFERVEI